ncbi:MAG: hypothetical protein AAFO82_09590 [Bacteroidota bacterium]
MLRLFTCIALISFSLSSNYAQKANKYLSGYWKGYITQGSLEATVGLPFEMYLEVKGYSVKGRTYVHQKNGEVIEMEVSGRLYSDNSLYLTEQQFIEREGSDVKPDHVKKYQFIYNRSIFESDNSLDGYWQEIIETPLALKRRRGKIVMKKGSAGKA